jgi:SPP1 gp7 family putative phage head morphogenesis protein
MMAKIEAFNLPFEEAINLFRSKGYTFSPASWRDVWKEEHQRAFTIARVTAGDVLVDIRREVQRALENGTSLGEFQKTIREKLIKKGWFAPEGEEAIIETPEGPRKRLKPWRIENIYRTNLQSSFSAGRYRQMKEVAKQRPFWQYRAVEDARTRPAHAAMNGRVFRHDDPIWDIWYPPNGFQCRCSVVTLSTRQVEASGLKVEKGAPAGIKPDKGWDYNVGESAWEGFTKNIKPEKGWQIIDPPSAMRNGLPKIKDMDPSQFNVIQPWEGGAFESRFSREVLGGRSELMIQGADGNPVIIGDFLLKKLPPDRYPYLAELKNTVEQADEVWLSTYQAEGGNLTFRQHYIRYFMKTGEPIEGLMAIVDTERAVGQTITVIPWRRAVYAENKRSGVLLYSKTPARLDTVPVSPTKTEAMRTNIGVGPSVSIKDRVPQPSSPVKPIVPPKPMPAPKTMADLEDRLNVMMDALKASGMEGTGKRVSFERLPLGYMIEGLGAISGDANYDTGVIRLSEEVFTSIQDVLSKGEIPNYFELEKVRTIFHEFGHLCGRKLNMSKYWENRNYQVLSEVINDWEARYECSEFLKRLGIRFNADDANQLITRKYGGLYQSWCINLRNILLRAGLSDSEISDLVTELNRYHDVEEYDDLIWSAIKKKSLYARQSSNLGTIIDRYVQESGPEIKRIFE